MKNFSAVPKRRSTAAIFLARLTLAAFVAALPGPGFAAQTIVEPVRLAPVGGSAASAASVTGALQTRTASFTAVGRPAVSFTTVRTAASSQVPGATEVNASVAAPVPNAVVLPARAASAIPTGAAAVTAAEPSKPTAREALQTASDEMSREPGGNGGGRQFDGQGKRNGGAGDDGGNRPPAAMPAPAAAPVIALNRMFFPGLGSVKLTISVNPENEEMIRAAVSGGGYMIITTVGHDTAQGHHEYGNLIRVSQWETDGKNQSVMMEIVRPVKIEGYDKNKAGVNIAKVSYPSSGAVNLTRLNELTDTVKDMLHQFSKLDKTISQDLVAEALEEMNYARMTNLLAQNLPFTPEIKQELLGAPSVEARLEGILFELMGRFKAVSDAKKAPAADGEEKGIDTLEGLKAKIQAIGMPDAVAQVALKEFKKFSEMNPKDSEAQKIKTYLEWLTELPWSARTEDNFDMARAKAIMDRDHTGLDKVKDRVLEFLALRKKTGSRKGAVLVFTGPPGTGKTSIAKSIAEALGRKFARLSLGGIHEEVFVRGHVRTYVGAMPGEFIRKMKQVGTVNPVLLLDEADKIGRNSTHGDPSAALLEILDPQQNDAFQDRFLEVPYDFSEVLFVVTANEVSLIPEALLSRMEVIEFDGYTTLEKVEIARRQIIPEMRAKAGLRPDESDLSKDAIRKIAEGYTMEAGVRNLREKIEAIFRKISAWTETRGEKVPALVEAKDVPKYLGVERFSPRQTAQNGVGVATGLAVNAYGGSTLNVEVSQEPGTGQLKLRKQFGDDIEDSARNAYKFVKLHKAKYGLADFDFTKIDLDINITPAGKVDGPSAGGLMVTAIISALTNRPVTPGLAMTGEITMRGDILPIGGLKQKVMAAHRMGYAEVIFPFANLKDIEDIPKEVRDGIKLKAAKTYDDIYPDAISPAAPATAAK